jgi:hypothetical protein
MSHYARIASVSWRRSTISGFFVQVQDGVRLIADSIENYM